MTVAQFIYNGVSAWPAMPIGARSSGALMARARQWYLQMFGDPLVRDTASGLWVPLSHPLGEWRRALPAYGRHLCPIAAAVRRADVPLLCIDVGANVGDTAAELLDAGASRVLAIEGASKYLEALTRNAAARPGIEILQAWLAEHEGASDAALEIHPGTASLNPDRRGPPIRTTTLDRAIEARSDFAGARLLKIDTDGYDGLVILGARRWLAAARPVIHFEYDPIWPLNRQKSGSTFDLLAALGYDRLHVYRNTGEFDRALPSRDRAAVDAILEETSPAGRSWFPEFTAWPQECFDAAAAVEAHYGTCAGAGVVA